MYADLTAISSVEVINLKNRTQKKQQNKRNGFIFYVGFLRDHPDSLKKSTKRTPIQYAVNRQEIYLFVRFRSNEIR